MNAAQFSGARCEVCGASGALADRDGICPVCLLDSMLADDANEEPEVSPRTKDTCGPYQLERLIGRGGNGMVFLARKSATRQPVALKMLASAHLAGPEELRRFRLEAAAAAELAHPHIIRVLESGEEDGTPWFAMDFAAAGSLADKLMAEGAAETLRSSPRGHVELMLKVSRAVHFAHQRGVLHRDLKPANVLLDENGDPLVADFGLARMIHAPSGVTMTGAALGTPAYMSPEQAAGVAVTTSSDVYSLGAVLFHLLTGKPPFEAPTPLEILRLSSSRDAPDPRTLASWIDKDLAMVCLKALRREQAARYESASALADDLDAWLRGEAVQARPLPWSEKFAKWCRRHPITASLTAAITVATLVLGVVLVLGSLMLREERDHAQRQEAIALTHAAAATRARDESRLHSYAADMYLAFRAFEDGHLGLARQMLGRQQVPADLDDLRGFEWHALNRRCKGDDLRCWLEHQGAVCAVAFSPDGKHLASGSRDGLLVIRSVPEGEPILVLPKPDAPRGAAEIPLITAATARSAAATRFLISSGVNPDDFRMRARTAKIGEVTSLAYSPDGRTLATAGLGSYVRLWSIPEGELRGIVPVTTATALDFTPDGRFLVVHLHADKDRNRHESRIYQSDSLSLHYAIGDLKETIALSPADGTLATVASGGTEVRLTNPATKQTIRTIQPSVPLKRMTFSRDGRFLHGVDSEGTTAGTWSVKTGARTAMLFPVAGRFDLLVPSPCGEFFASTGASQQIAWQQAEGSASAGLLGGHEDVIRALAASPDGRYLASGGNDHSLRLWPANAPEKAVAPVDPFLAIETPDAIREMLGKNGMLARTADGYWLGGSGVGADFRLVSRKGEFLRKVRAPEGSFERLSASRDGSRLAVLSWPRGLRVLAPDGNSWSREWILLSGTVGPIVFSPDGSLIASGGDDNIVSIRDSTDGRLVARLKGHQGVIIDLAFSPDGRTLASTAEDKTLRLWHCPTWRDLGVLHRGERISQLIFSPFGDVLHARSADGVREFGAAGP